MVGVIIIVSVVIFSHWEEWQKVIKGAHVSMRTSAAINGGKLTCHGY